MDKDISLKKPKDTSDVTLLKAVMDNIDTAIFMIDSKLEVLSYNKAFLEMFNIKHKKNEFNCFTEINIESKKSGVEYFKLRFNQKCENKCILNKAINKALIDNINTENSKVSGEYEKDNQLVKLHLNFSVKNFEVQSKRYTLVTIDDISEFETIKTHLIEKNIKIKELNETYKQELELAKSVQASILPKKLFIYKNYKIDFRYFPLAELSGDMFDFFKIDDDNIGILISDVGGHGLHSALITTMVKAIIESSRHLHLQPKNLVKYINNQIIKIFESCYLTMIYGVLNVSTGEFRYVRAGHPKPWLLRKNAVSTMGINNNMLLGFDPKIKFSEDTVHIKPCDSLILFTDGLIETGKDYLGYEKEIMNLIENNQFNDSEGMLDLIENNINDRLNHKKHLDDICILIIERYY